ncbi:hypothetical protein HD554DRAFT_2042382 [Boletus coccyginus]|nr:hypothetical protein HD554DRAFT_2042382 [Boletus coccyginus]
MVIDTSVVFVHLGSGQDLGNSALLLGSGLEIDSSHWHRFAFLRCYLCIFLINQRDYKDVPLDKLFSSVLAGLLQPDTLAHVTGELDINVADLQQEVHDKTDDPKIVDADHQDNDGELDPSSVGGAEDPSNNTNYDDEFSFLNLDNGASRTSQEDPDANWIPDDEHNGGNNSAAKPEVLVWISGQF